MDGAKKSDDEAQCAECGVTLKAKRLQAHLKKKHGIFYAQSKETYAVIINPHKGADGVCDSFQCPVCNCIKSTVKDLANHYATIHAKDVEKKVKTGRRRSKGKKGNYSKGSVFKEKYIAVRVVSGGAPGSGKRR